MGDTAAAAAGTSDDDVSTTGVEVAGAAEAVATEMEHFVSSISSSSDS